MVLITRGLACLSRAMQPLGRVAADVSRMLEVPVVRALEPRVTVYVKGGPLEPVQSAMPWATSVESLDNTGCSAHVSHWVSLDVVS